jgi:hypothetical protein
MLRRAIPAAPTVAGMAPGWHPSAAWSCSRWRAAAPKSPSRSALALRSAVRPYSNRMTGTAGKPEISRSEQAPVPGQDPGVLIDQHRARALNGRTRLKNQRVTMGRVLQSFHSLAAPARELVKPGPLLAKRADRSNPVTRWMAPNLAIAQDPAGNLKRAKDKSTEPIDVIIIIMAIGRATLEEQAVCMMASGSERRRREVSRLMGRQLSEIKQRWTSRPPPGSCCTCCLTPCRSACGRTC